VEPSPKPLPDPAACLSDKEESFVLALLKHEGDIATAYVKAMEPELRDRVAAYNKGIKLYTSPYVQAEYSRLVNITLLERTGGPYTTALRELVDIVTTPLKDISIKDKIAAAKAIFEAIGTRQEVSVTKKTEIGENLKELFQEIARGEDVVPVDAELMGVFETHDVPKEVKDILIPTGHGTAKVDGPGTLERLAPLAFVEGRMKDAETMEGIQLVLDKLKEDSLTEAVEASPEDSLPAAPDPSEASPSKSSTDPVPPGSSPEPQH